MRRNTIARSLIMLGLLAGACGTAAPSLPGAFGRADVPSATLQGPPAAGLRREGIRIDDPPVDDEAVGEGGELALTLPSPSGRGL